MTSRQASITLWLSLLGILLLSQRSPTYAGLEIVLPEAQPGASTALRQFNQPRLVAQLGHMYSVKSVCFSPDGHYVLTGSWDKTARLWDRETGKEIRKFEGPGVPNILAVAFSPDGRYVLTGSLFGSFGEPGQKGQDFIWGDGFQFPVTKFA